MYDAPPKLDFINIYIVFALYVAQATANVTSISRSLSRLIWSKVQSFPKARPPSKAHPTGDAKLTLSHQSMGNIDNQHGLPHRSDCA